MRSITNAAQVEFPVGPVLPRTPSEKCCDVLACMVRPPQHESKGRQGMHVAYYGPTQVSKSGKGSQPEM